MIGTADGVNDSYNGGTGTDTIDYSALTSLQNISVNLGSGFASGASIGTDTLSSFENANGGAGNDSLFGSNANNVLHGNGGTDNIVGSGGSDQLFGEAGNDTLNGGVNDFGMHAGRRQRRAVGRRRQRHVPLRGPLRRRLDRRGRKRRTGSTARTWCSSAMRRRRRSSRTSPAAC